MVSLQAAIAVLALAQGPTVLLDFYADWCGPCRSMDPTVKQLAAQGYPIQQINIDKERALAERFHIRSIPCFVMLSSGREIERVEGAVSAQRLIQICRSGSAGQKGTALAAQPGARPAPTEPGPTCPVPPATAMTAVPI